MAKDKITEYDATANNNTVCGDVNIAENSALPSDMNNFAREIMSHLKEGLGSGTPLYVDQTNNRLGINTSSPSVDLEISGGLSVDGGTIKLDGNYPTASNNVALGNFALDDGSLSGNANTAIGSSSMTANTSGQKNVGLGESALLSNTTGSFNTALGQASLESNTTASNNTAVGYQAGDALTNGAENVAVGSGALGAEVAGDNTVAIGKDALKVQQTNSNLDMHNVAVGHSSGFSDTTGRFNTFVGSQSGYSNTTASNNTAVGYTALEHNTTGTGNTSVGFRAGSENITGGSNTGLGQDALRFNTASNNTAVGYQAGYSNTTGASNTVIGRLASTASTTSQRNVVIGESAFVSATTASSENVVVGWQAGDAITSSSNQNTLVGANAGGTMTSSSNYNTCIGNNSGNGLTNLAYHNIFIGHASFTNGASTDRQIVIGTDINSVGGNHITMGRDSVGRVYNNYSANATWTRTSDERIKKDIQENTELGLDFVNDLRTVTYKWKAPSEHPTEFLSYDPNITEATHTNKMYGFIAQEVKTALDTHGITDFDGWVEHEGNGNQQGISYEMFVMPLVKAVQELSAKNDALEARIATLEGA